MPEAEELGRRIVGAHLAALKSLPARVCLVADVEQIALDRHGREVERFDLRHGAELPAAGRAWDWEIAPLGEVGRNRQLINKVSVFIL